MTHRYTSLQSASLFQTANTLLKSQKMDPLKTLARGCFGKVYKMKYKDIWAAVKKVPLGYITKEQLLREYRVYEKAHHNNLVMLLGDPWLENGNWNIPMEFIFGEDLETAIFNVQKSKIQLTPLVKATIISGMCEGLFHLHSKDIVHQDLKPDNIMIEHGTHRAVIIDMGLAKFCVNGLTSAENMGNPAYSAPEIWQGNVRDKRSDVWAMGKIIAELCAGVRLPTDVVSPLKIKETLKDNPYCGVVSKMVVTNATCRATMTDIVAEIRQPGPKQIAGVGVPNAGFGAQGCVRGTGAMDLGGKQRLYPPTPVSPNTRHKERQVEHIAYNPSQRAQALVPASANKLVPVLSHPSVPFPLPPDGKVVHHHYDEENGERTYEEITTRNGKVVKYDNFKITK